MKNFFKKSNENNGITLITLIITVIIMMILAGIALVNIGDSNFFDKFGISVNDYRQSSQNETHEVSDLINSVNLYMPDEKPIYKENKTFLGKKTGSYNDPIIPKGFYPINENGAVWGTEDGYKKGLVIEDEVGNQFVWVPVNEDIEFKQVEWRYPQGHFLEDLFIFIEDATIDEFDDLMPTELVQSVEINQGFYIARFETGISDEIKKAYNLSTGKNIENFDGDMTTLYGTGEFLPIVQKDSFVWKKIKYEDNNGNGVKKVAESLYKKDDENYGAVSTLIYGAQWDTALKFISTYDVGEEGYEMYPVNSTGYGNYKATSGGDDIVNITSAAKSGAREAFRQKNIYDLAGNVYEWTMEEYYGDIVIRGGAYNSIYDLVSAAERSYDAKNVITSSTGFRIAIYIK